MEWGAGKNVGLRQGVILGAENSKLPATGRKLCVFPNTSLCLPYYKFQIKFERKKEHQVCNPYNTFF